MIHIGRAGSVLGSFSEYEVKSGLKSGRFFMTDLGWKEGMGNWAPLSQFSEFAEPMPPLPEVEEEPATPEHEDAAETHAGLPWDDRKEIGWPRAFFETARLVFTNPNEAFARMRTEGPISGALFYNLIGGWLGMIASAVYAVATAPRIAPTANLTPMEQKFMLTPAMAMYALKLFIVLGPVIATVNTLILAAFAHLALMLVGGANRAFHVTLRVFCFSYGTTQLLQMLPFCGSPFALVWMAAAATIGLAVAHGTTTGRTMVAMLLFVGACFVCCLGVFALAAAAGGLDAGMPK